MQVEGHRIGSLKARDQRRQRWRELQKCTKRSVDMKPQTFAFADCGKFLQIVDCAGIDGSCISNNTERRAADLPIVRNARQQIRNGNSELVVNRNAAK